MGWRAWLLFADAVRWRPAHPRGRTTAAMPSSERGLLVGSQVAGRAPGERDHLGVRERAGAADGRTPREPLGPERRDQRLEERRRIVGPVEVVRGDLGGGAPAARRGGAGHHRAPAGTCRGRRSGRGDGRAAVPLQQHAELGQALGEDRRHDHDAELGRPATTPRHHDRPRRRRAGLRAPPRTPRPRRAVRTWRARPSSSAGSSPSMSTAPTSAYRRRPPRPCRSPAAVAPRTPRPPGRRRRARRRAASRAQPRASASPPVRHQSLPRRSAAAGMRASSAQATCTWASITPRRCLRGRRPRPARNRSAPR